MNEQRAAQTCPPVEELAAFIDGALAEEERDLVKAHLADCERCLEVYADTLRFQESESATTAPVTGLSSHRAKQTGTNGRGRRWWVGLAAAAALAVAIAIPLRDSILGPPTIGDQFLASQAAVHLDAATSGTTSFDATSWSYTRSGGSYSEGLSLQERSTRLGARLVDLEVALRSDNSQEAMALLPEIIDLTSSFEGAEHVAFAYRDLANRLKSGEQTGETLATSAQAEELLEGIADDDFVELGRWAEASRLAAAQGNTRFFGLETVRAFPSQFSGSLDGESEETLAQLGSLLSRGASPEDLGNLERLYSALLVAAGNP